MKSSPIILSCPFDILQFAYNINIIFYIIILYIYVCVCEYSWHDERFIVAYAGVYFTGYQCSHTEWSRNEENFIDDDWLTRME